MQNCPKCDESETMYKRPNDYRCYKCGFIHEPKTGLIDERPTKPYDAKCGELLMHVPNHDDRIPRMIRGMCNDNSNCSFNPTTMKETENGRWIATCTTHKDNE